jgi:hypothetical protein
LDFVGSHVRGTRSMVPVDEETSPPIRGHPGGGTLYGPQMTPEVPESRESSGS